MTNKHHSTHYSRRGFTIIELLVVVVVIAILAAIVTVAYNGIQKSAVASAMKQTVRQAATKMQEQSVGTESYSQSLPSVVKTPTGIGLALTVVSTEKEFCINITSQRYTELQWHISQTQVLEEGLCSGAVITASIVGDYYSSTPPTVVSSAVTVHGDEGGFKLETDEAWSTITLSWTPVPSVTRYEVQTRVAGGTWYTRSVSNGSNAYSADGLGTSGMLTASTTSLVWNHTNVRPTTPGQTYEYRYRSTAGSTVTNWSTISLTVPSTDTMGAVRNFTVTPDTAWSAVSINWEAPVGLGSPENVNYELLTRDSAGAWASRLISTGSGSYSAEGLSTSGLLPLTTTSLTWNHINSRPSTAGQTHEYKIRIKSTTNAGIYGPSSTVSLTVPTAASLPEVNNFTVVPNGAWTSIALSWEAPTGMGSPTNMGYNLMTRDSAGTWAARATSSGSGSYPSGGGGTSGSLPLTPTTLTWTHANSRPAAEQTHEYRIRAESSSTPAIFGPWKIVTLTR